MMASDATEQDREIGDRPSVQILLDCSKMTQQEMHLLLALCQAQGSTQPSADWVQQVFEGPHEETLTPGAARTRLYRLREKLRNLGRDRAEQLIRLVLTILERRTGTYLRYSRCGHCGTAMYLRPPDYKDAPVPSGYSCQACEERGGRKIDKVLLLERDLSDSQNRPSPSGVLDWTLDT